MYGVSFIALSKYLKIINYPSSLYYSTRRLCRHPLSPSSLSPLPHRTFCFSSSSRLFSCTYLFLFCFARFLFDETPSSWDCLVCFVGWLVWFLLWWINVGYQLCPSIMFCQESCMWLHDAETNFEFCGRWSSNYGNVFVAVCLAASHPGTFMEVVKKVYRQGTAAADSIAIRAEHKSYSYKQLISSAWEISDLLCNSGLETVSRY